METDEGSLSQTCSYSPTCVVSKARISEMCWVCKVEQARTWPKPY